MSHILPYRGIFPRLAPGVFTAPSASIIGDVEVGEESSIWYGAVLRGDVMPIRVGARTSIQDNSVVHATGGWHDATIGDDCTIGHGVILHGCRVGDRVLVGMGTIVLDAVEIGDDVMIGAGSLVTARTKIPAGMLAHGRPAKVIRELTAEERERIMEASSLYRRYGREHREAVESIR
jgi:carbonic anhydrase/acetyltransferase-like protein (isoleucine patch superfamily)